MEEIQSLVDISHIVPPMKMGKAAVCGYRHYRYGAATRFAASHARRGIRIDKYSCIWHERYWAMLVPTPIVEMLSIDIGDEILFGL
jgi:hypothetical protein